MLPDSATGLEATIRRTTNGVPHISSNSLEGVGFGAGYAQTQDNVCLLAESFVKAASERAKYFGPGDNDANIISDFSYKALDIMGGAEREYALISAESRALLDGFTAGYNQYVSETAAADLPVQCNGAPWVKPIRPQNLLAYYRIVGQYASGDRFASGAVFSAVPPGVSPLPSTSMDSATLHLQELGSQEHTSASLQDPARSATPFASVADNARLAALAQPDTKHDTIGSNAWGIGSSLTEGGRGALLANPHFPYTGSRRLYQMHMSIPGYLNVNGAGLIGTALPLISFNDNLA